VAVLSQRKRIGEVLKELGFITDEHIEIARKIQQFRRQKLGEILISSGFISPKELAMALSCQSCMPYVDDCLSIDPNDESLDRTDCMPYVDVDDYFPERDVLMLIDKRTAEANLCVILDRDKRGRILVAIPDPFDERKKATVRRMLKDYDVAFRIAEPPAIRKAIERFYSYYLSPIEELIRQEMVKRVDEINFDLLIDAILRFAVLNNVSDIHINPLEDVAFLFVRIDGILQPVEAFPKQSHFNFVSVIKLRSKMNVAERRIPQDGSFSYKVLGEDVDIRVSTLPTAFGEKVVMRILKKDFSKLNIRFLGYEPFQQELLYRAVKLPYGMVIVSGPTGSGKSTTLYSMLRSVDYLKKNVVTVEDPIEYKFNFIYQTEVNTSAGYKFSTALKYFMRQDPDVILVGEIRDSETADISVEAANTGHLLISTIHANDALTTVKRLLSLTSKKDVTLAVLKFVIAQRLIRRLCPFCKHPVDSEDIKYFFRAYLERFNIEEPKVFVSVGCDKCRNTGYIGRTVVAEVLEMNTELMDMFHKDAPLSQIETYLRESGFVSMKDAALIKVLKGETDIKEVERVLSVNVKEELQKSLS